jgi:hypothetical protein
MYRQNERVQAIVHRIMTSQSPTIIHGADPCRGVSGKRCHHDENCHKDSAAAYDEHLVWSVTNPEDIAAIKEAFESIESLYIADGHHRTASACRMALEQERNGGVGPQHAKYAS